MAEFVEGFITNPAREGPQVIASWTFPSGFSSLVDEIKLMRKQGSFSTSTTDGIEVFSSTTFAETNFADVNVTRGVCFYYKMFSKRKSDGLFVSNLTAQDEVVPYETGFFEEAFFTKLPSLYQITDETIGLQTVLSETTVSSSQASAGLREGQKLNIDEGIDPKGFLRRFLKIFAIEFDKLKETIEFYSVFFDLDETCAGYLPLISELLGITPNFDLTVDRQRDEIRRAVSTYKIKGTEPMLVSLISGLTQIVPTIDLWHDNVLISNNINSTSFSFEPSDIAKQYLADDPNDYVASDELLGYNFNKIAVFLDVSGKEVSKVVIDKLRRIIPDFVPARIEVIFTFFDSASEIYTVDAVETTDTTVTVGDLYDASNVIETFSDTIATGFLITNDPSRTTNSTFVTATGP